MNGLPAEVSRRRTVLRFGIALMIPAAAARLGYESWRLLAMSGKAGAIDLRALREQVLRWFGGQPVNPPHPPATMALLWPWLGWPGQVAARSLWWLSTAALLALLTALFVKGTGAGNPLERWFLVLIPLSIYPTAITIGNGQLGIMALTAALGAVLLLRPGQPVTRVRDTAAAGLAVISLVKPALSAPFLWLVLLLPGRFRPALMAAAGYAGLTLLAASFRMEPLSDQIGVFLAKGASVAATQGGANLHRWMGALGLERWMGAASLGVFLALGAWLRAHRRANPWMLLAVTALVARLWTYHRMYDDLLILVPMAALFPLAGDGAAGSGTRRTAGILFLLGWVGLEAPGTLARLPFPWNLPYEVAQPAIWLSMLAFLGRRARAGASPEGSRRLSSEPPPPAIRGGVGKV